MYCLNFDSVNGIPLQKVQEKCAVCDFAINVMGLERNLKCFFNSDDV